MLCQAEPVAAPGNEDHLDTVGIPGWWRGELDATAFQFFVGGAAIVGIEDAAAQVASEAWRPYSRGVIKNCAPVGTLARSTL